MDHIGYLDIHKTVGSNQVARTSYATHTKIRLNDTVARRTPSRHIFQTTLTSCRSKPNPDQSDNRASQTLCAVLQTGLPIHVWTS